MNLNIALYLDKSEPYKRTKNGNDFIPHCEGSVFLYEDQKLKQKVSEVFPKEYARMRVTSENTKIVASMQCGAAFVSCF